MQASNYAKGRNHCRINANYRFGKNGLLHEVYEHLFHISNLYARDGAIRRALLPKFDSLFLRVRNDFK